MAVSWISLVQRGDDRGGLVAIEGEQDIPFAIARVYYIYGVASQKRRGFHAHRALRQVAVCVAGSCRFHLDDGRSIDEVLLDSPSRGLLIETMVWREMYDFSPDCVLMVLASAHYDEADYIRDYDAFREACE